jgi:hypothetical protein
MITQQYWAQHDTHIGYAVHPYKHRLEAARRHRVDYLDIKALFTTIVTILSDMRGCTSIRFHYGRFWLPKALSQCGAEYMQYASIIDEQALVPGQPVASPYYCDLCTDHATLDIHGPRYTCLTCMDTDFCVKGFALWKEGGDQQEMCKGHEFREVPRPCWYTLEPGTVDENGRTLADVIEYLYGHFTTLLEDLTCVRESAGMEMVWAWRTPSENGHESNVSHHRAPAPTERPRTRIYTTYFVRL